MQSDALEKLSSALSQSDLLPESIQVLNKHVAALEKELAKKEFVISRTLKDKEIAINLLNTSLENLEFSNQELSRKNEEIRVKNEELERQKKLLEASSLKMEDKLRELKNSYEALEQFSYIASHDLKTPLRSIAGYAQLLQRRYAGQLDASAEEFIGFIVAGARHMNDIICDLLEYSRTSYKNQPKTLTNLNKVLETVKTNLAAEINQSSALIKVVGPLPVLYLHETGMVQLFQNLVSNAIKFRGTDAPRIEIAAESMGALWKLSVRDNGVGFDEAFSNKIFQPFQRLHPDRPGLGMGLAICKKIIQTHRGEFWARSSTGQGAVFYFTLPAKD